MHAQSNDTTRTQHNAERRRVLRSAAWSLPVIAASVVVPTAAATAVTQPTSPTTQPCITISTGGSPWSHAHKYKGWIAEGVTITVTARNGAPLAGEPVTLFLTQKLSDYQRWKRDNLWFVSDSTLSAHAACSRTSQSGSMTLYTDRDGVIRLDDGAGNGRLRKGHDGEREGQFLVARTSTGHEAFALLINCSTRGQNSGLRPAAG